MEEIRKYLKDQVLQNISFDSEPLFKKLRKNAEKMKQLHMKKESILNSLSPANDKQVQELELKILQVGEEVEKLNNEIQLFHYDEEKRSKIKPLHDQWQMKLGTPKNQGKNEALIKIYKELVIKVVEKSKSDLMSLLKVSSWEVPAYDELDTKSQYRIYGLLLSACKIKGMDSPLLLEKFAVNVKEFSSLNTEQFEYLQEKQKAAYVLSWDMLRLLPPLVVCKPPEYNEDEQVQDTNRATWDDEKVDEGPLTYYRPVLVYGNHLHMAVKGLVGNKELVEENDKDEQKPLPTGDTDSNADPEASLEPTPTTPSEEKVTETEAADTNQHNKGKHEERQSQEENNEGEDNVEDDNIAAKGDKKGAIFKETTEATKENDSKTKSEEDGGGTSNEANTIANDGKGEGDDTAEDIERSTPKKPNEGTTSNKATEASKEKDKTGQDKKGNMSEENNGAGNNNIPTEGSDEGASNSKENNKVNTNKGKDEDDNSAEDNKGSSSKNTDGAINDGSANKPINSGKNESNEEGSSTSNGGNTA